MSNDPIILEAAERQDGLKRWQLLRRSTGLYAYEEETLEEAVFWVDEDGGQRDILDDAYWAPTYVSGFFDTAEAAQADAYATLPWLREKL